MNILLLKSDGLRMGVRLQASGFRYYQNLLSKVPGTACSLRPEA
jgi:hypothetical protein